MTNTSQASPVNESLLDTEAVLQRINDDIATRLIPVYVYLSVLAFNGLIGNAMVFYYYSFKTKTVPTSVFITTLAIYDILACTICVPTEILDKVQYYTFTDAAACKILRFLGYFLTISSGLTLFTISIERYKQIRRVASKQMTTRSAKKYCVILAVVGFILTSPALALFDATQVVVPNNSGLNLTGYDCRMDIAKSYQPYVLAFNLFFTILVFVGAFGMSVMYGMIAWTVYKTKLRLVKSQNMLPSHGTKAAVARSVEETLTTKFVSETKTSTSGSASNESCVMQQHGDRTTTKNPKQHHRSGPKTSTVKMTILMSAIAILFVLSFLPHFALMVWWTVSRRPFVEYSNSEFIGLTIGTASWLCNSCLNPWIYGIFNSEFRKYYYNSMCCGTK